MSASSYHGLIRHMLMTNVPADETTMGSSKIVLSPAESLLREFLLECAQHFPGLEIYITGGWVRDRLLGVPTSDIDLGLNILTGRQFGRFIEEFSADAHIENKYSRKAADLGIPSLGGSTRFHIVQRNADASKKLETTGGRLFGLDVDLVNLRREVYDGQRRTPDMDFGTPQQDAFRRDATVNALFFDLQKSAVVDLTGKGLEDLASKTMRTPLDPRQTFLDDPLRVLRLVRIGSKLGFTISPESAECIKTNEIRRALDTMITRDRVNIEVFKMMRTPRAQALVAFETLFRLHLYVPVLVRFESPVVQALKADFPRLFGPATRLPWPASWPCAFRLLSFLLEHGDSNLGALVQSVHDVDHLWTMAAFAPLAGLRRSALKQTVREAADSLRTPAKLTKTLGGALVHFDAISQMVDSVAGPHEQQPSRGLVGMAIRSWGATWIAQVTFTLLSRAVYHDQEADSATTSCPFSAPESHPLVTKYAQFADFVSTRHLGEALQLRPVLDGNAIMALFEPTKGGPWVKEATDRLLEWQMDHVDSGTDEARKWLLSVRSELGLPS